MFILEATNGEYYSGTIYYEEGFNFHNSFIEKTMEISGDYFIAGGFALTLLDQNHKRKFKVWWRDIDIWMPETSTYRTKLRITFESEWAKTYYLDPVHTIQVINSTPKYPMEVINAFDLSLARCCLHAFNQESCKVLFHRDIWMVYFT